MMVFLRKRHMAMVVLSFALVFAFAELAQAAMVLKVGTSTSGEDERAQGVRKFKEIVEAKTNGEITVDFHPGAALGNDRDLIEGVKLGSVQMTVTGTANCANYEPRMGVTALPFLFPDFDTAWRFMDSGIMQDIQDSMLKSNIRILAYYCNGFRCVTNNKHPIVNPEDLKGLSLRTPEMPTVMATLRALGANPSPLPFSEVYIALSQGTFDGQENPIPTIYSGKLYEVQKYLSITNHAYDPMVFAITESTFKKMTPEQQEIVQEAARESAVFQRELIRKNTDGLLDELRKGGMEVNYPDLAVFKKATADVARSFEEEFTKDLVERAVSFK
jgi:tripartite ATP-independent transporter DctP family solute receptor